MPAATRPVRPLMALVTLMVAWLTLRFEKLLAMLAMDSFRITEFAEALIEFSPLILPLMPGKGRSALVYTSEMWFSSFTLSERRGARVGTWTADICD
jgi:hypothetical protein